MRETKAAVWRFCRRNALPGALLAAGLAVCVLLCGVARDKGFIGAQGANDVPPAQSHPASQPPQAEEAEEEPLPPTMTLRLGSVEQVVRAQGTVQSTTLQDVNTSLTKRVVAVHVQVGSYVNEGDALCQLDTGELDRDIEAARAAIARAEADDAQKLAQAQRKLALLQEERAQFEARRDEALRDTIATLEAARVQAATDTANRLVPKNSLDTFLADVRAAESQLLEVAEFFPDGTPNPAYDPEEYQRRLAVLNAAGIAYANAIEQYHIAWQNAYGEAYKNAPPPEETDTYKKLVTTWEDTLRKNQKDINDALSDVEKYQASDSAAEERAKLEKAEAERAQYTITSPVSGTVTAVGARVGNTPGKKDGDALFTIQSTGSLVVQALVDEADAVDLTVNMPVTVTAKALENETWNGVVSAISPIADDKARFTVTVRFVGGAGRLAVGMTADIEASTGLWQGVFTVPHSALAEDGEGQTVVYAADEPGGAFRAIPVRTGAESPRKVAIDGEGLAEGLVILTSPPDSDASAPEETQ